MAPFGSEDKKEICWDITTFKGMFGLDKQKPAINFSISWEMECVCESQKPYPDQFDMTRDTDPLCSEFSGRFQERTFSCDPGKNDGRFGIGPDCCTETKCSLVEKQISFAELMPIPFELVTPEDEIAGHTCEGGFDNWVPPPWGKNWPTVNPDNDPGLTPRAQALREFGCSLNGFYAYGTVGRAVMGGTQVLDQEVMKGPIQDEEIGTMRWLKLRSRGTKF